MMKNYTTKVLPGFLLLVFLCGDLKLLAQQVVIGTGTTTNFSGSYPAPLGAYYSSQKHQEAVK